ncbi:MAG: sigma-70 family RNA polymerase sigma factor [Planctomycetaceae bacterium]|nr:sigma-70 family RNA polymerase sigma factor [Planctomycetaceae bacterium]
MPHPETRHSLIVRLRNEQDEPAWREFVTTYESFLRKLVSRQGVPEHHVPDVTQQILIAIGRSVENWSPDDRPESFRRWLTTVSRHVVIKFMTRERKQAAGPGGTEWVEQLRSVPAVPDPGDDARYRHELIVWAAEQVRHEFLESSWSAFWLTVIEGLSVGEVAQQLGITPGSIYMSRSRIMSRIRKKIQELND